MAKFVKYALDKDGKDLNFVNLDLVKKIGYFVSEYEPFSHILNIYFIDGDVSQFHGDDAVRIFRILTSAM